MNDKFVCNQGNDDNPEIVGQKRVYALHKDCKITYNGRITDRWGLMPGDNLDIDGQPAVKIVATGPKRAVPVHMKEEQADAPTAGDDGQVPESGAVEQ